MSKPQPPASLASGHCKVIIRYISESQLWASVASGHFCNQLHHKPQPPASLVSGHGKVVIGYITIGENRGSLLNVLVSVSQLLLVFLGKRCRLARQEEEERGCKSCCMSSLLGGFRFRVSNALALLLLHDYQHNEGSWESGAGASVASKSLAPASANCGCIAGGTAHTFMAAFLGRNLFTIS